MKDSTFLLLTFYLIIYDQNLTIRSLFNILVYYLIFYFLLLFDIYFQIPIKYFINNFTLHGFPSLLTGPKGSGKTSLINASMSTLGKFLIFCCFCYCIIADTVTITTDYRLQIRITCPCSINWSVQLCTCSMLALDKTSIKCSRIFIKFLSVSVACSAKFKSFWWFLWYSFV